MTSAETVITNARLISEDGVKPGTIVFQGDRIHRVDYAKSHLRTAIDGEGDFLCPGLIEMHTDNMERHFMPRPEVIWPDPLGAALAHDAQMAAAGVTTVYDAICVGATDEPNEAYRRRISGQMIEAVRDGVAGAHFRIDHAIHLRCELSSPTLLDDLAPVVEDPLIRLASLMDHTPGQRQWRNLEHLRTYSAGQAKASEAFDREIDRRRVEGPEAVRINRVRVLEYLAARYLPIVTHDDTTEGDVADAIACGASIAEFPTTLEAARAAKSAGLATVAGAPNVVRGGSHSGGVSARDLVEEQLLDALSSDYVPSSLLQAAILIEAELRLALEQAIALVTWRVADMLKLPDRGRLLEGLRADLVRLSTSERNQASRAE